MLQQHAGLHSSLHSLFIPEHLTTLSTYCYGYQAGVLLKYCREFLQKYVSHILGLDFCALLHPPRAPLRRLFTFAFKDGVRLLYTELTSDKTGLFPAWADTNQQWLQWHCMCLPSAAVRTPVAGTTARHDVQGNPFFCPNAESANQKIFIPKLKHVNRDWQEEVLTTTLHLHHSSWQH